MTTSSIIVSTSSGFWLNCQNIVRSSSGFTRSLCLRLIWVGSSAEFCFWARPAWVGSSTEFCFLEGLVWVRSSIEIRFWEDLVWVRSSAEFCFWERPVWVRASAEFPFGVGWGTVRLLPELAFGECQTAACSLAKFLLWERLDDAEALICRCSNDHNPKRIRMETNATIAQTIVNSILSNTSAR